MFIVALSLFITAMFLLSLKEVIWKKKIISYLHYNSTMLTPQIQNEAVVYNIQL